MSDLAKVFLGVTLLFIVTFIMISILVSVPAIIILNFLGVLI